MERFAPYRLVVDCMKLARVATRHWLATHRAMVEAERFSTVSIWGPENWRSAALAIDGDLCWSTKPLAAKSVTNKWRPPPSQRRNPSWSPADWLLGWQAEKSC